LFCSSKGQCTCINQSDSWNTYKDDLPKRPSKPFVIAQTTAFVILGILIVLGNLACITTFVRTQSLRRRSNYLIINLAVADLFVGFVDLMAIHFFLKEYKTSSKFQDSFDVIFMFCDLLTGLSSIICLSTISVYRCLSAVVPLRHRSMSKLCYSLFIAFPWLIATFVSVFYSIDCTLCNSMKIYFVIIMPSLGVFVMVICYAIISFTLKQSSIASNRTGALRDRKTNFTLMIVTLASLLTWGPYQCFNSVAWFCDECKIPYEAILVMKLFQYFNSGLNIFIYITKMPHFKHAFLTIFYPQRCFLIRTRMPGRVRVAPVSVIC